MIVSERERMREVCTERESELIEYKHNYTSYVNMIHADLPSMMYLRLSQINTSIHTNRHILNLFNFES